MNILVSVAQWQREYIVEQVSRAFKYKAGQNELVGSVPYGFDLAEN